MWGHRQQIESNNVQQYTATETVPTAGIRKEVTENSFEPGPQTVHSHRPACIQVDPPRIRGVSHPKIMG